MIKDIIDQFLFRNRRKQSQIKSKVESASFKNVATVVDLVSSEEDREQKEAKEAYRMRRVHANRSSAKLSNEKKSRRRDRLMPSFMTGSWRMNEPEEYQMEAEANETSIAARVARKLSGASATNATVQQPKHVPTTDSIEPDSAFGLEQGPIHEGATTSKEPEVLPPTAAARVQQDSDYSPESEEDSKQPLVSSKGSKQGKQTSCKQDGEVTLSESDSLTIGQSSPQSPCATLNRESGLDLSDRAETKRRKKRSNQYMLKELEDFGPPGILSVCHKPKVFRSQYRTSKGRKFTNLLTEQLRHEVPLFTNEIPVIETVEDRLKGQYPNLILDPFRVEKGYFKAHLDADFVDSFAACMPECVRIKRNVARKGIAFISTTVATLSDTHYDQDTSFLLLLSGTKEVFYAPPAMADRLRQDNPVLSHSSIFEFVNPFVEATGTLWEFATLNAGDGLLLPQGWIHAVKSEPGTIAISFQVESSGIDATSPFVRRSRSTAPEDLRHLSTIVMEEDLDEYLELEAQEASSPPVASKPAAGSKRHDKSRPTSRNLADARPDEVKSTGRVAASRKASFKRPSAALKTTGLSRSKRQIDSTPPQDQDHDPFEFEWPPAPSPAAFIPRKRPSLQSPVPPSATRGAKKTPSPTYVIPRKRASLQPAVPPSATHSAKKTPPTYVIPRKRASLQPPVPMSATRSAKKTSPAASSPAVVVPRKRASLQPPVPPSVTHSAKKTPPAAVVPRKTASLQLPVPPSATHSATKTLPAASSPAAVVPRKRASLQPPVPPSATHSAEKTAPAAVVPRKSASLQPPVPPSVSRSTKKVAPAAVIPRKPASLQPPVLPPVLPPATRGTKRKSFPLEPPAPKRLTKRKSVGALPKHESAPKRATKRRKSLGALPKHESSAPKRATKRKSLGAIPKEIYYGTRKQLPSERNPANVRRSGRDKHFCGVAGCKNMFPASGLMWVMVLQLGSRNVYDLPEVPTFHPKHLICTECRETKGDAIFFPEEVLNSEDKEEIKGWDKYRFYTSTKADYQKWADHKGENGKILSAF